MLFRNLLLLTDPAPAPSAFVKAETWYVSASSSGLGVLLGVWKCFIYVHIYFIIYILLHMCTVYVTWIKTWERQGRHDGRGARKAPPNHCPSQGPFRTAAPAWQGSLRVGNKSNSISPGFGSGRPAGLARWESNSEFWPLATGKPRLSRV